MDETVQDGTKVKELKLTQTVSTVYIPGWDPMNGNTNSCLYKAFSNGRPSTAVVSYDLNGLDDDGIIDDRALDRLRSTNLINQHDTFTIYAHSAGLTYLCLLGLTPKDFDNVAIMVILDGWLSELCIKHVGDFMNVIPEHVPIVFLSPTDGDRTPYAKTKEVMIDPVVKARKNAYHVKVEGLRHNFIYDGFTKEQFLTMMEGVEGFVEMEEKSETGVEFVIKSPWEKVDTMIPERPSCTQQLEEEEE
jgi:hypothetical protein